MKGLVLLGRTSGGTAHTAPPIPAALSKIFWATQMQIHLLNLSGLSKSLLLFFFFSLLLFPFSALWILNHQDLLMSNKHKNASLSIFTAKARTIIKLNPGHMAWVLLLETSPGSGTEGGINPWQKKTGKTGWSPHSSLGQGGRNSCPQGDRVVGHAQDW